MEEIKSNEQLSKKEQRQLRRQEKNDEQGLSRRKKKMKKSLKWSIGILVAVGASHEAYNSNPPTSGPHYEQPSRWGVSQAELPDEQLIHNLEHGGIWISYVGIDDSTIAALEKIAKSQSKVIVEPRAKNDAPIVLASWERLLKLEKFDEQIILDFIKSNKNRSPEPFAQ